MKKFLWVGLVLVLVLTLAVIKYPQNIKTKARIPGNWGRVNVGSSELHVAGDKIVNEKNEEVYLRGFQGIQFYPIPTEFYFQAVARNKANAYLLDDYAVDLAKYKYTDFDVDEIKSTGANVVRIWFSLHEIQKNGTVWLEHMREFVNCALQAQKIARAENNCHDLSIMAKKVGSNFFLMNRRLSASFKKGGFDALSAEAGAESATSRPLSNSYWLGGRDSDPDASLQRAVSYR